jgi:hypothetical protein
MRSPPPALLTSSLTLLLYCSKSPARSLRHMKDVRKRPARSVVSPLCSQIGHPTVLASISRPPAASFIICAFLASATFFLSKGTFRGSAPSLLTTWSHPWLRYRFRPSAWSLERDVVHNDYGCQAVVVQAMSEAAIAGITYARMQSNSLGFRLDLTISMHDCFRNFGFPLERGTLRGKSQV